MTKPAEVTEAMKAFHDDLSRQLLDDADEIEACGGGNEAVNMRRVVKELLKARADLAMTAARTIEPGEVERLQADCRFLLSVIDSCNEAGCPPDEMDPEDLAMIAQIRAAITALQLPQADRPGEAGELPERLLAIASALDDGRMVYEEDTQVIRRAATKLAQTLSGEPPP